MAILSEQDQQFLRDRFAKELSASVKLVHFTQRETGLIVPGRPTCPTCRDTRTILEEVADLAEAITLEVHDFYGEPEEAHTFRIDKIPATVITSNGPSGVRYFGIPAGYEFATLIEDIVAVSKASPELSTKTKEELAKLQSDVHIQVFVTPTWPYCPSAASLAHRFALENPRITADVIEAQEFPTLVQRYRIRGVPKIVINDRVEFEGAVPQARYLQFFKKAVGLPEEADTSP